MGISTNKQTTPTQQTPKKTKKMKKQSTSIYTALLLINIVAVTLANPRQLSVMHEDTIYNALKDQAKFLSALNRSKFEKTMFETCLRHMPTHATCIAEAER